MANFTETLELLLRADASQGISAVRGFADATEKSVGQAESSIKRLSAGALKLGGSGMALGGFLTAMSDKDVQSMKGLEAAISATGHAVDEYQGRIDDTISKQAKFAHTDGEVTESLNTLVGSYGDADKALDRMQLVADLAAKKHISLASAAEIVAKAHGGAGKIFKEFNIQVGTNADGTKDYEGALDQLSQKVNGQAAASVSGFTGWLKVQGAELENVVSALGEKYGPAILGVSTALTALGGITQAVTAIQARHAAVTTEEAAAAGMSKVAMLGVVGALGALAGAYAYGKSNAEQFTLSLEKMTNAEIDQYLGKIIAAAKLTGTSLYDVGRNMPIEQAQRLADALDRSGQSSADVRRAIADQQQAQDDTKSATDNLTGSTKDLTTATYDYLGAMKKVDEERISQLDGVTGVYEAQIQLTDSEITAREKLAELTAAQKNHKLSADEQTKALTSAEDAIIAQGKAAAELAGKQAEMAGATDTASVRQAAEVTALTNVMNALAPDSPLRVYLQGYINDLNSVPTGRSTTLSIVTNTSAGGGGVNLGNGRIAAASGYQGWVKGPQEFLVGEAGEDEYVSITPKSKMRSGGGSGGSPGGPQVVFAPNITVHSLDPKAAGKAVHDALHNFVRSDVIAPNLKKAFA